MDDSMFMPLGDDQKQSIEVAENQEVELPDVGGG